MTHTEIAKHLGRAFLIINGTGLSDAILCPVDVIDHKQAYGSDRWLISPIGGHGSRYVEASSLKFEDRG
jgi:hypothetical protein